MPTSLHEDLLSSFPSSESVEATAIEIDSPTEQGYISVLTSSVNVVKESDEVQLRRATRSYFCELIAVIVKVSSKRRGSDMAICEGPWWNDQACSIGISTCSNSNKPTLDLNASRRIKSQNESNENDWRFCGHGFLLDFWLAADCTKQAVWLIALD